MGGITPGTIVDISIQDPVLSDVNNLPMSTQTAPHSFYLGQPPVGFTIENVSGQMEPGGFGTFEVHMENTEAVNILEFTTIIEELEIFPIVLHQEVLILELINLVDY